MLSARCCRASAIRSEALVGRRIRIRILGRQACISQRRGYSQNLASNPGDQKPTAQQKESANETGDCPPLPFRNPPWFSAEENTFRPHRGSQPPPFLVHRDTLFQPLNIPVGESKCLPGISDAATSSFIRQYVVRPKDLYPDLSDELLRVANNNDIWNPFRKLPEPALKVPWPTLAEVLVHSYERSFWHPVLKAKYPAKAREYVLRHEGYQSRGTHYLWSVPESMILQYLPNCLPAGTTTTLIKALFQHPTFRVLLASRFGINHENLTRLPKSGANGFKFPKLLTQWTYNRIPLRTLSDVNASLLKLKRLEVMIGSYKTFSEIQNTRTGDGLKIIERSLPAWLGLVTSSGLRPDRKELSDPGISLEAQWFAELCGDVMFLLIHSLIRDANEFLKDPKKFYESSNADQGRKIFKTGTRLKETEVQVQMPAARDLHHKADIHDPEMASEVDESLKSHPRDRSRPPEGMSRRLHKLTKELNAINSRSPLTVDKSKSSNSTPKNINSDTLAHVQETLFPDNWDSILENKTTKKAESWGANAISSETQDSSNTATDPKRKPFRIQDIEFFEGKIEALATRKTEQRVLQRKEKLAARRALRAIQKAENGKVAGTPPVRFQVSKMTKLKNDYVELDGQRNNMSRTQSSVIYCPVRRLKLNEDVVDTDQVHESKKPMSQAEDNIDRSASTQAASLDTESSAIGLSNLEHHLLNITINEGRPTFFASKSGQTPESSNQSIPVGNNFPNSNSGSVEQRSADPKSMDPKSFENTRVEPKPPEKRSVELSSTTTEPNNGILGSLGKKFGGWFS